MLSRLRHVLLPLLVVGLAGCSQLGLGAGDDEPVRVQPPKVGQCRLLTPSDIALPSNDTAPVDCGSRHTAETFAVGRFPAKVAEGGIDDPALGAHVFDTCERQFRGWVGGDESQIMRATVTWAWFRPSEEAWEAGARWWRCDVVGGGEQSRRLVTLPDTTRGILRGMPDDRWLVCVDGPTVAGSAKIPCDQPHTWRAVGTIVVGEPEDPYPGDKVVEARTRDSCSEWVGAWLNYPVDYDYAFTWFHEAEWEAGNRRSICWAKTGQ